MAVLTAAMTFSSSRMEREAKSAATSADSSAVSVSASSDSVPLSAAVSVTSAGLSAAAPRSVGLVKKTRLSTQALSFSSSKAAVGLMV